LNDLKSSLKICVSKWAEREKVDEQVLMKWYNKVIDDTSKAVTRLTKNVKKTKKMTLKSPVISKLLEDLQKDFFSCQRIKLVTISLLSVRNFTLNNL